MAESRDIIEYLWETYGQGAAPKRGPLAVPSSGLASAMRLWRGSFAKTSARAPEEPLVLYSFEASPYSRLVREVLAEMELPYLLRSMAKEKAGDIGTSWLRLERGEYRPVRGGRREALEEMGGKIQVPYLIDPNAGVAMYESSDIIDHLRQTYD